MTELMAMPTSLAAEWSVLASMLRTPDVIGELVGAQLEARDFSMPDTRLIYTTCVESYYAQRAVDPLVVGETCREELTRYWSLADPSTAAQGLVDRVIRGLVPGEVLEHVAIVKKLSTARQLMAVCTDALAAIQEGAQSPEEVGDVMSTAALQITSGHVKRSELLGWMDVGRSYATHLQKLIAAREQGIEIGVYTGLHCIDDFTAGIGPGELCFLAGEPGAGKALALDTPLPTPYGWTTMERVQPGESLLGADGKPCRVLDVSLVEYDRRCYRVMFSDGASLIADADHQWFTQTRKERLSGSPGSVRTTQEIADSLVSVVGGDTKRLDGTTTARLNHTVPLAQPLHLPEIELIVPPYVLGCWLGDGRTGNARLTCAEPELIEEIRREGYEVEKKVEQSEHMWLIVGLGQQLAELGLLGEKHVPLEYLRASWVQRADLLGGIVDTDGYVDARGRTEVTLMEGRLADDVFELALTLGLKVTRKRSRAMLDGRFAGWRSRIWWRSDLQVARLARKRQDLTLPARTAMWGRRYIRAVTPIPSVPVKCVCVDSGDSLYLAGREMIPTHNSALAWSALMGFVARQMKRPAELRVGTLVLSLEMGLYGSTQRVVQSLTGIDGVKLREGNVTKQEYRRVLTEWKNRENLPVIWNFASNFRLSQMRALIAEAIRRHHVGFVVLDHFRMVDTDRKYTQKVDEDEAKVRFIAENIAQDLNVAVLVIAHSVKVGRDSPRPRLVDLRGSGQIAAAADFVGFLFSPGKHMSDEAREEMGGDDSDLMDMEIEWAKNRWGSTAPAKCRLLPETMTFVDRY